MLVCKEIQARLDQTWSTVQSILHERWLLQNKGAPISQIDLDRLTLNFIEMVVGDQLMIQQGRAPRRGGTKKHN